MGPPAGQVFSNPFSLYIPERSGPRHSKSWQLADVIKEVIKTIENNNFVQIDLLEIIKKIIKGLILSIQFVTRYLIYIV
jgi:hypothetical protein